MLLLAIGKHWEMQGVASFPPSFFTIRFSKEVA